MKILTGFLARSLTHSPAELTISRNLRLNSFFFKLYHSEEMRGVVYYK